MIKCPLCQQYVVILGTNENAYVSDGSTEDYYCLTQVKVVVSGAHYYEYHYSRVMTRLGEFRFSMLVPPFYIVWLEDQKILKVSNFKGWRSNSTAELICEKSNVEMDEFLKCYEKYKNLIVFS